MFFCFMSPYKTTLCKYLSLKCTGKVFYIFKNLHLPVVGSEPYNLVLDLEMSPLVQ